MNTFAVFAPFAAKQKQSKRRTRRASGAATAPEDEKDLDKVALDLHRYEIYREGFLKACPSLTPLETELLPAGAWTITLEQGARFLADYLSGDVYFKTAYPEHNLVRARTQLKLVKEMEEQWDEMKTIVRKFR